MKVKKIKALKRHIRSLKQNDELFKKQEYKILSVNVSEDLKSFEFKFDDDKNEDDIYLELGEDYNKTSIVRQLNHLINITELDDILKGKTSTV